jgi:hypothetical protein
MGEIDCSEWWLTNKGKSEKNFIDGAVLGKTGCAGSPRQPLPAPERRAFAAVRFKSKRQLLMCNPYNDAVLASIFASVHQKVK